MQVQIKFTKTGANASFGGFSPGDIARVNQDLAKHFVEDAGVAVYIEKAVVKEDKAVDEKPIVKSKKK